MEFLVRYETALTLLLGDAGLQGAGATLTVMKAWRSTVTEIDRGSRMESTTKPRGTRH
jgi:hypothetical protein